MNVWSNAVLTDKGRALLAKLTQGNTLDITKAITGAGFVTPGLLREQTAVSIPKQELNAGPVAYPETGRCDLPLNLTNEGLEAGYEATQVGVFANDPDEGEILFFISQSISADTGTTIPSESEMPGYCAEWTFRLQYGQADSVNVTVDPSNTVSPSELETYIKENVLPVTSEQISSLFDSSDVSTDDKMRFLDFEGLAQFKSELNGVDIVPAAGDGTVYTATVPGITALVAGYTITIIPDTSSATTIPKLNLNNLGQKNIKQRISTITSLTVAAKNDNWMIANKPVPLMYDGTQWVTITGRPSASDLYGEASVENGGTGADNAEEARTNLDAQQQHTAVTITLPASGWADGQQTVNVAGVTATNTVVVCAHPDDNEVYSESAILCKTQGSGTLSFKCESVPTSDVKANVIILN